MSFKDFFKKEPEPLNEQQASDTGEALIGLPLAPADEGVSKWMQQLGADLLANTALRRKTQTGTVDEVERLRDVFLKWGVSHPSFTEIYKFLYHKECPWDGDQTLENMQVILTLMGICNTLEQLQANGHGGSALNAAEIEELIKKSGVN